MKIHSAAKHSIAIGLMALITSCDDPKKPQGKVQQSLTTEELAREAEFGPWMSKAGLMFAQEQLPIGDYFAEIEGRVHKGENQYRAIQRTLDSGKYLMVEAVWGLEADSLFQYEIARLRNGMERSASQVFTDSTGKAIHQLVMVLPVGARPIEGEGPDLASNEDEIAPLIRETGSEGVVPPTPPPGLTASEIESSEAEIEPEGIPGPVEATNDAIVVSPEVTPLEQVTEETGEATEPASGPDMTDGPAPEPATTSEAGETSGEVGTVIGELETPDPETEPEPEIGSAPDEPDEPEVPARAEVVEDDENAPEAGSDDPGSEPDSTSEPESTPPVVEEPAPLPEFISYKVVRGDTLSALSRRYKVSISAIKKASGIRSDMLRIGQTLKIPTK